MQKTKLTSVEVGLHWASLDARHTDRRLLNRINFQSDIFPRNLGAELEHADEGVMRTAAFTPEDTHLERDDNLLRTIKHGQFKTRPRPHLQITPRAGRFYPRDFITGVDSHLQGDKRPCRCLSVEQEQLRFDFNPPFAGYSGELSARVVREPGEVEAHGGGCTDVIMDMTQSGPGMQARLPRQETDFFYEGAFDRLDPRDDAEFYQRPRLVEHLDTTAIDHIREIYARFIEPGMKVLDLMSSWVSHLPQLADVAVTGLGMNEEELQQNPQLQHWLVHDLNRDTGIAQPQEHFDAAICTASVEYLIDPVRVFESVAHVLKPRAPFVVTFSDRWFPSKAIALWEELHPFERMGLVLAYFRKSQAFDRLATESIQYWPRPKDDKYAQRMLYSDPVFAIWGYRKSAWTNTIV